MKIDPKTLAVSKRLHPLRDNIVIKRLEYEHEFLYVAGQKLNKGIIVAVGPGRRMRKKTRFDKLPGKEDGSIWFEDGGETGVVRPIRVRLYDIVEFGQRGTTEFYVDGEEFVLLGEQSLYGKTNASQSKGLMGLQSAGFAKAESFGA